MNYLKQLLSYEPVVAAWAVSGGLAILLGSVFHISSTEEAAVTTIVTALAGIYSWSMTQQKSVSILTGAISTIIVAAAAFGLHVPSNVLGVGVAVLSAVIMLVLRQNVSPTAALKPDVSK